MMKIKVFKDFRFFDEQIRDCEDDVNKFIKYEDVVDIKYSVGENGDNFMVIYKEKEDD